MHVSKLLLIDVFSPFPTLCHTQSMSVCGLLQFLYWNYWVSPQQDRAPFLWDRPKGPNTLHINLTKLFQFSLSRPKAWSESEQCRGRVFSRDDPTEKKLASGEHTWTQYQGSEWRGARVHRNSRVRPWSISKRKEHSQKCTLYVRTYPDKIPISHDWHFMQMCCIVSDWEMLWFETEC